MDEKFIKTDLSRQNNSEVVPDLLRFSTRQWAEHRLSQRNDAKCKNIHNSK